MSVTRDWILVAGYGSIGRRHFRNLRVLGYSDVRLLRSGRRPAPGFETPPGTREYDDLDAALDDRPFAVVVATPTALHAETAKAAVRSGAHVVLEKPVAARLDESRALLRDVQDAPGVCSVAYCFRYHPLYLELKRMVDEDLLGRIFHAHTWQASYLPDWHPWEDYRRSYASRADLGGGVVRTLDHDLDMIRWLLGQPSEVLASSGTLGALETDVEDTADMIFRFPNRVQAHAHVCFARRDYSRGMWLVGERAGAALDWGARSLQVRDGRSVLHETILPSAFDLNDMYVDMIRDAMEAFRADPPSAAVPLSDGVAALQMASGALRSNRERRTIALYPVPHAAWAGAGTMTAGIHSNSADRGIHAGSATTIDSNVSR